MKSTQNMSRFCVGCSSVYSTECMTLYCITSIGQEQAIRLHLFRCGQLNDSLGWDTDWIKSVFWQKQANILELNWIRCMWAVSALRPVIFCYFRSHFLKLWYMRLDIYFITNKVFLDHGSWLYVFMSHLFEKSLWLKIICVPKSF